MKRLVVIILSLILSACSSTRAVKRLSTLPTFRATEVKISKGIDADTATPLNPTTMFTTEDIEVIASVKLKNLTGKHTLRWDWYDPNGKLYYSTGNYPIKTSKGKYRKEVTAWHRLSIRGEMIAEHTGDWQVRVYLDNDPIAFASKDFKIEMDIHTLPDVDVKPDPKNWGFIIGIEEYANLVNVDYAENDAILVKKYFKKFLGVPEKNIISLINEEATKTNIVGELEYIKRNIEQDGTLYFYYAGHGMPDLEEFAPYLIPYDIKKRFLYSRESLSKTSYELSQLYKDLEGVGAEKVFVFLDACFTGNASRRPEEMLTTVRGIIPVYPVTTDKVVAFSASGNKEVSQPYKDKEHGLFTYFLLKGMRKGDANGDGLIKVSELYKYVKENVSEVSKRIGPDQTPQITPPIDFRLFEVSSG